MPDGFKTGECAGSAPVFFLFSVVQGSGIGSEGVLFFATALEDTYFLFRTFAL